MRIFVTGAAGFIGFHLSKALLDQGHHVVGYDGMTAYYDLNQKHRRLDILRAYPFYQHIVGMLEDVELLHRCVESSKANAIVHLAAQAGVRYSLENPTAYINSNIVGSYNILEAARIYKPDHLLLASTSSVYGANLKIPFSETDKTDEPLTLYAATKKSMEVMAHSYSHLWRIPTTAFRFFTVYGPYGRPDMALFKFAEAATAGKSIDVYGHGQQQRDFTYIADLVQSIIDLIGVIPDEANRVTIEGAEDSLSPQAPFRIVNIGGGDPVGLLDFINVLEEELKVPIVRNYLPMQKGDVPRTFASTQLLRALTGSSPATNIKHGVRKFVEWFGSQDQKSILDKK